MAVLNVVIPSGAGAARCCGHFSPVTEHEGVSRCILGYVLDTMELVVCRVCSHMLGG